MTIPKRRPGVRYEVNICGGGFDALKSHFNEWKHEPLIYRPERRMFEGKADVEAARRRDVRLDRARFALQRVRAVRCVCARRAGAR